MISMVTEDSKNFISYGLGWNNYEIDYTNHEDKIYSDFKMDDESECMECTDSCTTSCAWWCKGTCDLNCGPCGGDCVGRCSTGCKGCSGCGGCDGSCSGCSGCSGCGGCDYGCSGSCKNGCYGLCLGSGGKIGVGGSSKTGRFYAGIAGVIKQSTSEYADINGVKKHL